MFKFLNKLLKKKPMASIEQLDNIRAGLSRYQAFQWIKGENAGMQMALADVVEDDGIVFVCFSNGTRCNISLLDQYIIKLSPGDAPLEFNEAAETATRAAVEQSMENATPAVVGSARMRPAQQREALIPSSPIQELLKKRKPNLMGISIDLELNVPPKELLSVLEDSFENAEDEVVSFVLSSINTDDIRKSVKSALTEYYNKNKKENQSHE
jgi:phosphoribosyl-AMP cyclohydrolase